MFKPENVVVVAGAGAGKTYTLVQEYLFSLLGLDGENEIRDPRNVLAVTFTDKAAKEMRERVVDRLKGLLADPKADVGVMERLKISGKSLPSKFVMKQLLRLLPEAQICTFHSFCANILKRFPVEAAVDPAFDLLHPKDEANLLEAAAEATILKRLSAGLPGGSDEIRATREDRKQDDKSLEKLLVTFQLRRMGDAQGLIDMIVSLYNNLCEHGVDPANVHLANAVNLEGASISEHIQSIREEFREYDLPGVKLSGKAAEKLATAEKAFYELEGLLHEVSTRMDPRLPSEDREPAFSHAFSKFRGTLKGRFGPDELRKKVVLAASKLGSYLCDMHTLSEISVVGDLLADFSQEVRLRKKKLGALGFGDLLMGAQQLLAEDKLVRRKIKSEFKRILVDEFQDTSPLQEDLMALIAESMDGEGDVPAEGRIMGTLLLAQNKLFIVGDPKQSIYGFRGADAQLFVHTLEVIASGSLPGVPSTGSRRTLDLCRRSQGAVVDVVNLVAEDNISNGQDGVPFEAEDRLAALRKPMNNAGAIWEAEMGIDENHNETIASNIATRLEELVKIGDAQPSDFAILVRRISAGERIREYLQSLGIPARIYGGAGFFARQEVMDFVALLKLAVDPNCQLSILSVLRSPFLKLSDDQISEMISGQLDWEGGANFKQLCDLYPKQFDALLGVILDIRRKIFRGDFGDIVLLILESSHYLRHISGHEDYEQKVANILKLQWLYVSEGQDHIAHINKLWTSILTNPKESLAPILGSDPSVQIMTIHQSKGLEFKNVIVADTYATIPSSKDIVSFDPDVGLALTHKGRPIAACGPGASDKLDAPTAMDRVKHRAKMREEAELSRLLYVALTRARDKIYWTQARDAQGKLHQSRGLSMDDLWQSAAQKNQKAFAALMPVAGGA